MITPLLLLLPLVTIGSAFVCSCERKTCPKLDTVNDHSTKYADIQPVFLKFVTKGENEGVDNVCFTYTQVNQNTLVIYLTETSCNGTYKTTTLVGTQMYPGIFRSSSPTSPLTDFSLGYVGCDTDLHYDCYDCKGSPDIAQGISWTYKKFTTSCYLEAEKILKSQGLPDDIYVLPMKLSPNCFYPQRCLAVNPFDCYGYQTSAGYPYFAIGYIYSC